MCWQDIVLEPKFADKDIVREKSVVNSKKSAWPRITLRIWSTSFSRRDFWSTHSLGKPILGTPELDGFIVHARCAARLVPSVLRAPNQIVITAAGHLRHEQLVDLVSERFSGLAPVPDRFTDPKPIPAPHITLRSKAELEQVHLCIGVPSFPLTDRRRFAASLLNSVLGGGMSSRLFQNIREQQGLAYSIFSDLNSYRDTGALSVYAGTSLETAEQLIRSVAR